MSEFEKLSTKDAVAEVENILGLNPLDPERAIHETEVLLKGTRRFFIGRELYRLRDKASNSIRDSYLNVSTDPYRNFRAVLGLVGTAGLSLTVAKMVGNNDFREYGMFVLLVGIALVPAIKDTYGVASDILRNSQKKSPEITKNDDSEMVIS